MHSIAIKRRHKRKKSPPTPLVPPTADEVFQQALSGTDKTAPFCADIIQNIDNSFLGCQALVLAPTRERALEIEVILGVLGENLNIKCHACIGGTPIRQETHTLQSGLFHIVVGTPGRVYDMLRRNALHTDYIKMFVLDEANTLLNTDFKDQVYKIFVSLPLDVHVCITAGGAALKYARKLMQKYIHILGKREEIKGSKQSYVNEGNEE